MLNGLIGATTKFISVRKVWKKLDLDLRSKIRLFFAVFKSTAKSDAAGRTLEANLLMHRCPVDGAFDSLILRRSENRLLLTTGWLSQPKVKLMSFVAMIIKVMEIV